ncbi:MAG: ATP-dependent DNA helicase RecG [Bacteroidota bacterium]
MHPFWQTDITYLKRVGPKRAELLGKECNIHTFLDLLAYYPRKYVDRSRVSKVRDLRQSLSHVSLVGRITHFSLSSTKKGRKILTATFSDGSGNLELTWFQGIKWIQNSLKIGEEIAVFGKPNLYNGQWQITHPEMDHLKAETGARSTGQIVPFYPSTEKLSRIGLDSRGIRTIMHNLLELGQIHFEETLNQEICDQYQLLGRSQALMNVHFPENYDMLNRALRRLKFEEFFFFQLLLARKRKYSRNTNQSMPFPKIGAYFHDFFNHHMPFELTAAQKRVLKEIRKDLGRAIQMNRLVQGDVGSGKTMVAFMSMLIAKDNGFQSAIMAPTAILADQHYQKITKMAEKVGITTRLIVGGQRKKQRTEILESIASGEADIVIGTHAIIEDTVKFHRLGLVVVDEQHKFGVVQRSKLWHKADPFPHNLIMTATPIPRTLAMTLYGDVDVSVIDELPPGRKPIQTLVFKESKRLEVFGFIRKEIAKGRQVYVVYPLVEESEKLDLLAAEKGAELLERHFAEFRVGLVHGKMKAGAKDIEMERFVNKKAQILVSTTVIEVGVDVPNATIMVIENAERFGLSQLHQLRGRVGRGDHQSYCILMSGYKVSSDGKKRLQAMKDTTDGFKISEIDLELRGPGDFLGTRQSGLPEFQLANIVEDQELLQQAREAAFFLTEEDPQLQLPKHLAIKANFTRYARKHISLGTVA